MLQACLERLQDRADDGAGERRAHPLERGAVLFEERGRVDRGLAACGVVLLPEGHAWVFPEHLVRLHVAQLDPRGHDDRVARGQLLLVEAGWNNRHGGHLARQQRVDAGAFRQRLILPAADELRAHFLCEQRLQIEDRRAIEKRRNTDGADVVRQEGAATGERVAARWEQPSTTEDTNDTEDKISTRSHDDTTTDTSGPFATTTLRM